MHCKSPPDEEKRLWQDFQPSLSIADELNTLVCMREGGKNLKKVSFAIDSFSPSPVPVMTEIALSVILSVNKPFTALFLFKLFSGKPTGTSFWV